MNASTTTLSASAHLSSRCESVIRRLPGNDRCVDCKAIYPQWASVSFGILLCLGCAGKHRSLGVNVSFVKSLVMDSWNTQEQLAVRLGGNAKWTAVCIGANINDLVMEVKYTHQVADAYKLRLLAVAKHWNDASPNGTEVQKAPQLTATEFLATFHRRSINDETSLVLDDQLLHPIVVTSRTPSLNIPAPTRQSDGNKSHRKAFAVEIPTTSSSWTPSSSSPTSSSSCSSSSGALSVKCTTCQASLPLDELDAHSNACVVNPSTLSSPMWKKYKRRFGVAGVSLGLSLTKTRGGHAEVTKLTPDGHAEQAQVLVGSYVIGVNGTNASRYEEVMELVSSSSRPIEFEFAFRLRQSPTKPVVPFVISTVPEPISVEHEVTFDESDLGCDFEATEFECAVKRLLDGGVAMRNGVLVGSRVVEVNGRRFHKGMDVLGHIQHSRRPLRLRFLRVEGLMRDWDSSSGAY